VPDEERTRTQAIRVDRHEMVHESGEVELNHTFDTACRRLHAFLNRLPDEW
jgi:hypothetical protein